MHHAPHVEEENFVVFGNFLDARPNLQRLQTHALMERSIDWKKAWLEGIQQSKRRSIMVQIRSVVEC